MDKEEHLDQKNKHVIDYDEDERKKHVIDDDEDEKKKKVNAKGATSILEGVSLLHVYGIKPHHLPNELVEKILPRLDVKPLLRFQLVSKDWKLMIRKPELTMQHKEMKPNPNYLFLLTSASEARPEICFTRIEVHPYRKRPKQEIILNVSHNITEREVPGHREYSLPNASVAFRSQAVNGLVCTFGSNGLDYKVFILNPYTRILLNLPDGPPQSPHVQSPSDFHNEIAFHFGFDPNREEYKVLQAQWALKGATALDSIFPGKVLEFKLCIITLGSNEWRQIEPSPFLTASQAYDFLDNANKSLFVRASGSIYWLYLRSVLAFDIGLETFSLIQVPQSFRFPFCFASELCLFEVEESLALIWKDIYNQPWLSIRRHDSWELREETGFPVGKQVFLKLSSR
ncbi:hypothetical protein ACE6H2_020972 [Prunus campanulata]